MYIIFIIYILILILKSTHRAVYDFIQEVKVIKASWATMEYTTLTFK